MKLRPHFNVRRLSLRLGVCALLLCAAPAAWAQKSLTADSSRHTALEQEVIDEINFARTRPAEYAAYLEGLRPFFKGKEYRPPGRPALMTEEGVAPLEEAIKFLRASKPLPALGVSRGLCSGARLLVDEQGASGSTGHKSADGALCEQRAQRFGSWQGDLGENLTYGPDSARERVLTLLIDDGFANRGHRLRILNPQYKVIGVACGPHQMGAACVINFAGGFTDGPARPAAAGQKPAAAPKLPAGARRF
jgi:hypothetical protein